MLIPFQLILWIHLTLNWVEIASDYVVDFKNKIHRKGKPDDYISKSTNIDYIPYKVLTSSYKSFSELPAAEKLTVMREQREPAIKAYFNQKIKEILKKDPIGIILVILFKPKYTKTSANVPVIAPAITGRVL